MAEIVKGVAEPVQAMQNAIEEIRSGLEETRKELSQLKTSEDARVTEKAQDTPAASLSAIIARTIVGNEQAKVDYQKDRKQYQSGPEEADSAESVTGITSIDAMIKEQQGMRRTIVAQSNGQS